MLYFSQDIEPNDDHSVYLDGQHITATIGHTFAAVYEAHLDSLMRGIQTPWPSVDLIFPDDGQPIVYHHADIIGACERYCGITSSLYYLTLSHAGLGALLRKHLRGKLKRSRFSDRIIEEARRRNDR